MLSSWLRRSAAILASAAAVVALSVSVSVPASAANNCYYNEQGALVCDVEVEVPGTPGTETPGTGPADFTPGPTSCVHTPKDGTEPAEVPCSKDGGWWSNERQCYWSLDNPQRPAPTGRDASVGAWYSCDPIEACTGRGCYDVSLWLLTPPPGVAQYTPAQAAGMLARSFVLQPVQIGMAPESKVHTDDPAGTAPYRRTWVGIPVWLWVDNPTESTWGPISRTATYGGVTVTGTASVQSLAYTSGDGQTIGCASGGTPFDAVAMANKPAVDSPTCGFRYQKQSDGGTFTVTATSTWSVEWTGGGDSGRIQLPSTSSSTQVRVGELQSVNVTTDGDTFGG